MKYQAIIFDLFDTVVLFDYAKMPEVEVQGQIKRTTMGKTFDILKGQLPSLSWDSFWAALTAADRSIEFMKREGREVCSTERFLRTLRNLGVSDESLLSRDVIRDLVWKHMDALLACAYLPADHVEILRRLRSKYKVALLSNFDYAPAARRMLDEMNLGDYFMEVAISDELGWRKPHPRPFLHVVQGLRVSPRDCLYVGDTYETDVVGAKKAGLDAAWVNRKERVLGPEEFRPELEIASLRELEEQLTSQEDADSP